MNSIYQMLNSNNIIAQFEAFKSSFQGDPKAEVQKLLDSGRMTQEQFNKLAGIATQLQSMLKR